MNKHKSPILIANSCVSDSWICICWSIHALTRYDEMAQVEQQEQHIFPTIRCASATITIRYYPTRTLLYYRKLFATQAQILHIYIYRYIFISVGFEIHYTTEWGSRSTSPSMSSRFCRYSVTQRMREDRVRRTLHNHTFQSMREIMKRSNNTSDAKMTTSPFKVLPHKAHNIETHYRATPRAFIHPKCWLKRKPHTQHSSYIRIQWHNLCIK